MNIFAIFKAGCCQFFTHSNCAHRGGDTAAKPIVDGCSLDNALLDVQEMGEKHVIKHSLLYPSLVLFIRRRNSRTSYSLVSGDLKL